MESAYLQIFIRDHALNIIRALFDPNDYILHECGYEFTAQFTELDLCDEQKQLFYDLLSLDNSAGIVISDTAIELFYT
jgi:hypothetical protein